VPGSAEQARFQILALDGGGAKALFTAHVLDRLEQDLQINLTDAFDLIAGTSAGGIVALGLGAGLAPRDIVSHYEELTQTVFPRARRRPWRRIRQWTSPLYDAESLRAVLTDVLGERRLADSSKRLVIPAWDVGRGSVHVFKTPHHERLRRDWRIPMVDVAMATSAAPTFFPAACVDGHRLVDGGVWANNPSVIAVAEAVSMLGVPLSEIRVLNVGTTEPVSHHPKRRDQGGVMQWAKSIAPTLVEAASRGGQGAAEHLVGKEHFQRFDARVPGGLYELDSVDADDIAGLAASVSRELSPAYTERFAGHRAPEFSPFLD
jgi:patatin-like phospholipase/acyl hydrolase